jgi:hypothetical protein
MLRSLNQTSRSSLGVNLPLKWIQKFGLKSKDKVYVLEKGNHVIISTNNLKEKDITIDLREGNITSIRQTIYQLYMEGYDTIRINYKAKIRDFWSDGVKYLSTKELIQKTVNNLMLLECMELSDSQAILQTMETNYSIKDFKRIMRLTFILINNFAQDINKKIKKQNKNHKFLESQHNNIRRYIRYCNRYLAKVGLGNETLRCKDLFSKLERLTICLKFMYTMDKELPIKLNFSKEAIELFNDITKLLQESIYNFNNYDTKKAAYIYEKRRKLTLRTYQLSKSKNQADVAISQRWVEILSKIVFIVNYSIPIKPEK